MKSFLKRLLGHKRPESHCEPMVLQEPPEDLTDGDAWDQYWENHLQLGLGPPLFDMMVDDQDLVALMRRANLSSVLCVGNGISMEPRALAAAGFTVTTLDVAPRASSFAKRLPLSDEYIASLIGEREQRPGGRAEFVVGDVMDVTLCPGPYDVIIERRTAQNYAAHQTMATFLAAAAKRLAAKGVFVSHFHDGAWRPGQELRHLPGEWFKQHGWTIWRGLAGDAVHQRVAWLITSTG